MTVHVGLSTDAEGRGRLSTRVNQPLVSSETINRWSADRVIRDEPADCISLRHGSRAKMSERGQETGGSGRQAKVARVRGTHAAGELSVDGTRTLVLLATNDTHSQMEPAKDGLGGIARRATYLNELRAAHPAGSTLLLDVGDAFLGSLYFTFFGGEVELLTMAHLGYRCVHTRAPARYPCCYPMLLLLITACPLCPHTRRPAGPWRWGTTILTGADCRT